MSDCKIHTVEVIGSNPIAPTNTPPNIIAHIGPPFDVAQGRDFACGL